jgi:hypothetical protein
MKTVLHVALILSNEEDDIVLAESGIHEVLLRHDEGVSLSDVASVACDHVARMVDAAAAHDGMTAYVYVPSTKVQIDLVDPEGVNIEALAHVIEVLDVEQIGDLEDLLDAGVWRKTQGDVAGADPTDVAMGKALGLADALERLLDSVRDVQELVYDVNSVMHAAIDAQEALTTFENNLLLEAVRAGFVDDTQQA